MANFVTGFHNLEGDLVNERKKSFFKLLKTTSLNSSESEIDNALKNIQPKTYQEGLFWVETLIFFKKTEALLEILKEGNIEHIKIIIRQKWFIEEAFKNTSPVEFVNDFLPCVSYSTRLKILRKISCCWSEDKMDQLFDAIQKRYGLFTALGVVHACSVSKISNLFKEYEVVMNGYQIEQIFYKNEELFALYVDHIFGIFNKPFEEQPILNSLAIKNPTLFLQLLALKKINPGKLTKAATVKILNIVKNEFIENSNSYINIFNKRAVVKYLGSYFKLFFKNIFPTKIENFSNKIRETNQFLKYIPKSQRWELFNETFSVCFPNKSLEELFEYVDILNLYPSSNIKMKWAEVKITKLNDENFLKYYPTSVGIPIIKEKINVSSNIQRRETLLKLLIIICGENKDINALNSVLQYIGFRHKNENVYIYKELIELVFEVFDTDKLTKEIWDFIRKQLVLLRTNGTHFFGYQNISEKLLEYSYKHDKAMFKLVATEYIQDITENIFFYRIYMDHETERDVYYEFCKLFPTTINSNISNFSSIQHSIISNFYSVCRAFPNNPINLLEFPYLLSIIVEVLNKKKFGGYDLSILKYAIQYHLDFPQYPLPFFNESTIIELFILSNGEDEFVAKIIEHITQKKVLSLIETNILIKSIENSDILEMIQSWKLESIVKSMIPYHIKILFKYFEKIYPKMWFIGYRYNEFKYYSHLGIDSKMCECLIEEWCKLDSEEKEKRIQILIDLLPENELIEFINNQLDNETLSIKLEENILNSLIKINKPVIFLPLILKMCRSGNIEYSIPTLYNIFFRISEEILHIHLKTLSEQNEPIGKHYIFLSCALLNQKSIIELFNTAENSKDLCAAAVKYFKNNQSQELQLLACKLITQFKNSDQMLYKKLCNIVIPKKYRALYIEKTWYLIESCKNLNRDLKIYFEKLLIQTFDKFVISSLSNSFINHIVNQYLPVEGKTRLIQVDQFVVLCLIHREQERNIILENSLEILTKLNKPTFKLFCTTLIECVHNQKTNFNLLQLFVENWNRIVPLTDALDEHIILNLLIAYLHNSIEDFSKSIINYFEKLTAEFGLQVYDIFKSNLGQTINRLDKIDQYKLFNLLLNLNSSTTTCIMVIQLITPTCEEDNEELKIEFETVKSKLEKNNEILVKIYYETFLC